MLWSGDVLNVDIHVILIWASWTSVAFLLRTEKPEGLRAKRQRKASLLPLPLILEQPSARELSAALPGFLH